ncbi:MAG: sulfatase [Dissulfurispiraceae bacterium]
MKNIILISIDNLRFDCVGYQPDKKELVKYDVLRTLETPTLDRIAERSLCFTKCISTNTYTTAAHASMLTGLYPPEHGVRAFYQQKISKDVHTLAEILKVFGYETVMMTDVASLFQPLELHRGFDHFFHNDDIGLFKFLDENKAKKLFIFLHFYDVHSPFLLSKNPQYINDEYVTAITALYRKYNLEMHQPRKKNHKKYRKLWLDLINHIGYASHETFFPLYGRGVSWFDQGRFQCCVDRLGAMNLLEDSMLVIASDHGEGKSLPENPSKFDHGGCLFDSVIRVPLMICHQDFSPRLIEDTVSIVDIVPTILDLAVNDRVKDQLSYPLSGIPLTTSEKNHERSVYSETWCPEKRSFKVPEIFPSNFLYQRSVRKNVSKFIMQGNPESSDFEGDTQNVSQEEFVKNVYRGLLLRFEGFTEYLQALNDLKEKKMTKDSFLRKTINSLEYRSKNRYVMYDLVEDPFEDNPGKIDGTSLLSGEARNNFDAILRISGNPVQSDDIFPQDDEIIREIVKKAFNQDWKEKADLLIDNKHLLTCLMEDFIIQKKLNNIRRKNKVVRNFFTSEEFSRFLYDRMNNLNSKSFIVRKILTSLIPYDKLHKIYFSLIKIFPRHTKTGKWLYRFMTRVMYS